MLLYNISIIVEDQHHDDLVTWINREWLPSLPDQVRFLKMLNSPHEGTTYCVQMLVPTEQDVAVFQEKFLTQLNERIGMHHHEKAFIFDSLMRYLN